MKKEILLLGGLFLLIVLYQQTKGPQTVIIRCPPPERKKLSKSRRRNKVRIQPNTLHYTSKPNYQRIGHLTNSSKQSVLPLYGRPTNFRSYQWNYYTTFAITDYQGAYIPIESERRNCLEQFGCKEIYTGDTVLVQNEPYTVTLYSSFEL